MKIEPGCMAIIINSVMGNNGKSLIVDEFIGGLFDLWTTDFQHIHDDGVINNEVMESQLMRIDGLKGDDEVLCTVEIPKSDKLSIIYPE